MSSNLPFQEWNEVLASERLTGALLERVRVLPCVASAGGVDNLPLSGGSNQPVAIEGRPVVAMSEQPEVSVRVDTPGYLTAMHVPLLAGRDINFNDTADTAPVVVISQSMAKQFWPNEIPIGRHLKLTFVSDQEREIVGMVGDVKQTGLDSSAGIATLYWPLAQVTASTLGAWHSSPLFLAVRTTTAPLNLASGITDAVHRVNKDVPVDSVMTLEDFVGETLTSQSFNVRLLGVFAALALVLCAVGIYSVLAYSVRRRLREIGLRIAFGASLKDVARLVVLQGMKPTLAGIAIGLVAAVALGRVVTNLIYGVSAVDLVTFSAVTLLLLVSLGASIVPAVRAVQVDPLTVLRDE